MILNFHHIGIACVDISESALNYQQLGYVPEGSIFNDESIGVRGQFMTMKNAPRIELVENLNDSSILNGWLRAGSPMYHLAFMINIPFHKFERGIGEIIVFGPSPAVAFQEGEVWFSMRENRQLIEYIYVKK